MKKVPASEATRKRLEEEFSGEHIDPGRIVREATRLMIEQALEAKVEQPHAPPLKSASRSRIHSTHET